MTLTNRFFSDTCPQFACSLPIFFWWAPKRSLLVFSCFAPPIGFDLTGIPLYLSRPLAASRWNWNWNGADKLEGNWWLYWDLTFQGRSQDIFPPSGAVPIDYSFALVCKTRRKGGDETILYSRHEEKRCLKHETKVGKCQEYFPRTNKKEIEALSQQLSARRREKAIYSGGHCSFDVWPVFSLYILR